jgi:trigger factor
MAKAKHGAAESDEPQAASEAVEEVKLENGTTGEEGAEKKERLNLEVKVDTRSACQRHITVVIPREDIQRYVDHEYSELVTSAQVPGFRPGHAPRKLIEHRFHKDVAERVKGALLADSMAQIDEDQKLSPISEPDFDLGAIDVPDEGPMTFEFDLEVRPEFDVPEWKGLKLEKPVHEFNDKDVDAATLSLLARYGQLIPHQGPAEAGDYISTNLTFTREGQTLSSAEEELIRIRPVLSFRDGKIANFDKLMKGVKAGETRVGEAALSEDAPNDALRGKTVTATFEIKEVKKLKMPEMTPEFLQDLGGFDSEAELRDAVLENLERQLQYQQHRRAREQITAKLTVSATWDLPPSLLKRQAERELSRAVLELRRSGFNDDQIQAYENELRQNSLQTTARALKEHFILERIAEDEKVEDVPEDYDEEIKLIAEQSGETVRRVRARLEKAGRMDVLRNQVIERKVIERILAQATFKEVPYTPEGTEAEAVDWAAGGGEQTSDIPDAKPEHEEKSASHGKHVEEPSESE